MIQRIIGLCFLTLAGTAMATETPEYEVLVQDGKFEVQGSVPVVILALLAAGYL